MTRPKPPSIESLLERIDYVCGLMNDWLMVVSFGLFVIDLMFLIAWLAPPTPTIHYDAPTEKAPQDGQPAQADKGVP